MTVAEVLKCVDVDASAVEIQEGKRYLIFVNAAAIDLRDLDQMDVEADIQFIALVLPIGSVRDSVTAFELPASK